jgi:hypothetical protein
MGRHFKISCSVYRLPDHERPSLETIRTAATQITIEITMDQIITARIIHLIIITTATSVLITAITMLVIRVQIVTAL